MSINVEKIGRIRMLEKLENCTICPHNCKINRANGQVGRCKSKDTVKIALYSTHNFEEPCISGKNGSGTIFFSNCNMNCVFCQNYEISQEGKGREISIKELAEIFIKQQDNKVENINLVTPTSYVLQIIEAIKIARNKGLKIPIVYNTNGYEKVETLKMLEGYIDIYLPDLKYSDDLLAKRLSKVDNYFEIATKAIKEMYRQTGKTQFDENGLMKKGMIIRHLVLPNHILNSRRVLKWINDNINEVYVSIMAQYFPTYKAKEIEDINRKLTTKEYEEIENYLYRLNLENGYIQELGEHEEEYVPNWNDASLF
jgi:putative pyruvate formate lyase activating enzyme